MLVDVNWMKEKFDYYNELCFDGKCPKCEFRVNMSGKFWGKATCIWLPSPWDDYTVATSDLTITMSNIYDSPEEVKINTLVHEMIHIMDYTQHPEHFVRRTPHTFHLRKVKYDAHGTAYFLAEAQRLKQYGLNINKYVQEEEKKLSKLSNKISDRFYYLVKLNFTHPKETNKECFIVKTSLNTLNKLKDNIIDRYGHPNGFHVKDFLTSIQFYKTSLTEFQLYTNRATLRGYYTSHADFMKTLESEDKPTQMVEEWNYNQQPNYNPNEIINAFYYEFPDGNYINFNFSVRLKEIVNSIIKKYPQLTSQEIEKIIEKGKNKIMPIQFNSFNENTIKETINNFIENHFPSENDNHSIDEDDIDYETYSNGYTVRLPNGGIFMELA